MNTKLDRTGRSHHPAPAPIEYRDAAADAELSFTSGIDEALLRFTGRQLVTATEVVDLLLDLRLRVGVDAALHDLLDVP